MQLTVIEKYIRDEETDRLLDAAPYDYAVDAIDTLSPKLALIKGCLDRGIPLVSSMGAVGVSSGWVRSAVKWRGWLRLSAAR